LVLMHYKDIVTGLPPASSEHLSRSAAVNYIIFAITHFSEG
jgi:hypothetical protein